MSQLQGSYEESVQRNIGVLSENEQDIIRNTHIGLLGAGGVGGLTSILLAKMGFGKITIYDRDVYEISNLNRQMLATMKTVGHNKADVAQEKLVLHNPYTDIRCHAVDLDSIENIEKAYYGVHIIIIAVDNLSTVVRIVRAAKRLQIPAVVTGPFGWKSFASVIYPQGPDYEAMIGAPSFGKELTDELAQQLDIYQREFVYHTGGFTEDVALKMRYHESPIVTFAPTVNLTACAGVLEAVKVLTNRGNVNKFPQYFTLDLLTGEPWSVHEAGMKVVQSFKERMNMDTQV